MGGFLLFGFSHYFFVKFDLINTDHGTAKVSIIKDNSKIIRNNKLNSTSNPDETELLEEDR
jgi:hypothetical protein